MARIRPSRVFHIFLGGYVLWFGVFFFLTFPRNLNSTTFSVYGGLSNAAVSAFRLKQMSNVQVPVEATQPPAATETGTKTLLKLGCWAHHDVDHRQVKENMGSNTIAPRKRFYDIFYVKIFGEYTSTLIKQIHYTYLWESPNPRSWTRFQYAGFSSPSSRPFPSGCTKTLMLWVEKLVVQTSSLPPPPRHTHL